MNASLRVAVIGAQGRLGCFAVELLARTPGFELAGAFGRADDWPARVGACGATVALEATHAGLGLEHGLTLLERGLRPVIATSGVDAEQNAVLDARARELALGGLVVPNFSVGAWLAQRFGEEAARWFDAVEIVERHHERKRDAPSGTSLETARRIVRARAEAGLAPFAPHDASSSAGASASARGDVRGGVPIHSIRAPGFYAHQELVFGRAGESLSVRHDMHAPDAFGPGLLLALRHAASAVGVGRGLDAAFEAHRERGNP